MTISVDQAKDLWGQHSPIHIYFNDYSLLLKIQADDHSGIDHFYKP